MAIQSTKLNYTFIMLHFVYILNCQKSFPTGNNIIEPDKYFIVKILQKPLFHPKTPFSSKNPKKPHINQKTKLKLH